MQNSTTSPARATRIRRARRPAIALAFVALTTSIGGVGCASSGDGTFKSPDAAASALTRAIRERDRSALRKMLGDEAEAVLASGDSVADRARRERFLRAYDERHVIAPDPQGGMVLIVGKEDWPMPIPIVEDENGRWRFDTEAGKDEILNRRIGQNELEVIEVCHAIVDAQREYAARDPDGDGVPEYARKFFSDPGKKDGLYWRTGEGEAPSPLGPFVAEAAAEGYKAGEKPIPFHGYYYRILDGGQGASAPGGATDYVINGRFIGGFTVLAYPAIYGNSGIMTFAVGADGVIYQSDLGAETESAAKAINVFDPGSNWRKAEPGPTPAEHAAAETK